jgi:SAM-dependent methyltransferase
MQAYKKTSDVLEQRLINISPALASVSSFLEIGAADAAFLAMVHERFPAVGCYSIEPDQNTRAARDALPWLRQSSSLTEAIEAGTTADLIAMFHVFEHINQPAEFLASVRQVLSPSGRLLIEVPSLTDPLLSLYASSAYQSFYFQCQHPYVYSAPSLERVLAANGFAVEYSIPYQRYSLENHLQWLTAARPGGNPQFRKRACLEQSGKTDTIIVLAKAMA